VSEGNRAIAQVYDNKSHTVVSAAGRSLEVSASVQEPFTPGPWNVSARLWRKSSRACHAGSFHS
jgi:hypothetical protein